MRLSVHTRSGIPAFDLHCEPLDSADAVLALAAKKASMAKADVRLSHGGRLLEGKDTMQQIGVLDGDTVLLHLRVGAKPVVAAAAGAAGVKKGSEGFFVNVVTAEGRQFFRPKVLPADDVGRVLDEVLSRVRRSPADDLFGGGSGGGTEGVTRAKLAHHGKPLQRGQTVGWHGIREGDELVLHMGGLEGDLLLEDKHKASKEAAQAAATAPHTKRMAPGRRPASARTPVPSGARAGASGRPADARSSAALSFLPTSKRATSSSDRWSKDGRTNGSLERLVGRREEFQMAVDADVRAAADVVYDAVAREVKQLHKHNRSLRDQLRRRHRGDRHGGGGGGDRYGDDSDEYSSDYDEYSSAEYSSDEELVYTTDSKGNTLLVPARTLTQQPRAAGKPTRAGGKSAAAAASSSSSSSRHPVVHGRIPSRGGRAAAATRRRSPARTEGEVPQATRDAFDTFDSNDSGFISAKELRKALRHYGLSLNTREAARLLVRYDETPDGHLDLLEFDALVSDLEVSDLTSQHHAASAAAARGGKAGAESGAKVGRGAAKGGSRSESKERSPTRGGGKAAAPRPAAAAAAAAAAGGRRRLTASQVNGRVPERISAAFAHFDANASGYLDYRELRNALRHYGVDVDNEGARAVVAAYDDTPDGKMDLREFEELVRDIEDGETYLPASSSGGGYPAAPQAFATPVGAQYASYLQQQQQQQQPHPQHPQHPQRPHPQQPRWSEPRRAKEAAALRALERELRDDVLSEHLLTEELEEQERTQMEREEELTQAMVEELEREAMDEEIATEQLVEQIATEDDPYDLWFQQHYGHPSYANGFGIGPPRGRQGWYGAGEGSQYGGGAPAALGGGGGDAYAYAGLSDAEWNGYGEPGYRYYVLNEAEYEDDALDHKAERERRQKGGGGAKKGRGGVAKKDGGGSSRRGDRVKGDVGGRTSSRSPISGRGGGSGGGSGPPAAKPETAAQGRLRSEGRNVYGASAAASAFAKFDGNGSGYLDYRELRNALRHYGVDVDNEGAKNVLAAYDDTPDGKMDSREFYALVRDLEDGETRIGELTSRPAGRKQASTAEKGSAQGARGGGEGRRSSQADVAAAFHHFDVNASGYLDYRELRNALRHYGVDVDTEGAKRLLLEYDEHPDGKLELAEFEELVRDLEDGKLPEDTSGAAPAASSKKGGGAGTGRRMAKGPVTRKQVGGASAGSASAPASSPRSIAITFAHFDANASGYLDYRELRNALRHYGVDVDNEGARAVVAAYDDTPDGKMDLREFEELVHDIEDGITRAPGGKRGGATPAASSKKGGGAGTGKKSSAREKSPAREEVAKGGSTLRSSRIRPVGASGANRRAGGGGVDAPACGMSSSHGSCGGWTAGSASSGPGGGLTTWAGRAPLHQSYDRRDVAPRSSAAHYGLPRSDSFVSLGSSSEDAEEHARRDGRRGGKAASGKAASGEAASGDGGSRYRDAGRHGDGRSPMGLQRLQFVSHELGLSSHGTRSQLLERLSVCLDEAAVREGVDKGSMLPLEAAIDNLYTRLLDRPGAPMAEARPFDDVLRSKGRWSSERDRTGPYRRLSELGGMVPNHQQRAMYVLPAQQGAFY